MPNKYWQGGAAAVAQVQSYAFAGTWEATDLIRVQIGNRIYDFTAGSTTTQTVVDNLVAAWNLLSSTLYPEFAELTASNSTTTFKLTADTAGVPFTCTLTPLETGGSGADAQTIEGAGTATTGTETTANAGPNVWTTAANWSGGAVPADADVCYFRNSNIDVLYGIDLDDRDLSIVVDMSFTGKIGLPLTNPSGYFEYRPTYLKIGNNGTQSITIGQGTGAGSGRIKINSGTLATTVVVYNTGTPAENGLEAFLYKGANASNSVSINKGSVGIAVLPFDKYEAAEEAATIPALSIGYVTNPAGDAVVRCGAVTLTTIDKSGGKLEVNTGATTITHTGGELTLAGGITGTAVTVTTLNERGGTTYVTGVTTITTPNLANAGVLDYSRDMRSKTITNPVNIYGNQAKFIDPYKVTGSVVIDCEQGGALANLNLGQNIKLTRGTPT